MLNKKDIILKGVAASSGIAIGRVFLFEDDNYFCLISKEIPKNARAAEKEHLDDAIERTESELKVVYGKINDVPGENYTHIVDAHLLILHNPAMKANIYKLIDAGANAEYAVYKVMEQIIHSFEIIENDYFKERKADIQDVGKKILANLLGKQRKTPLSLNKDSIVVSHNLTLADTVTIREKSVKGFATDIGGKTSHMAIIAQGLALPAVVGLKTVSSQVRTGDIIIVDGNAGEVVLNPSFKTIVKYKKECAAQAEKIKELENLKNLPAQTIDNHKVLILANIDTPDEAASVLLNGASGIGLCRTEFMYYNRDSMPSEQEHFERYSSVVKAISPLETTIRTTDLGGDKLAKLGLLNEKKEKNPFLGLRAIRLCLKYADMFIAQLRGILKASAYGKIRLMYPMISGLDELREVNEILEKTKQDLRSKCVKFDEEMEVGVMIEVPSATVIIDDIAKEVDFVSIGTNDLIQYTLAVDRINEDVANLYNPLHPAILRFIKQIVDAGHRAGIDVGICGEMAGDARYTAILLGLGVDKFSVSPFQTPKIKRAIRSMYLADAKKTTDEILKCGDSESILKIINKH
ncbi:phosphoenolpyruvate-protein phosphotransferase [Endomicrobiia bacterium]|nr:phosphoenolpyruvate-protein phosphotransferase [Endomicrobiia bacterium]